MKSTNINKALSLVLLVASAILAGALYLVYLPLAIVRVVIDTKGFSDFLDCVGDCMKIVIRWFRKGNNDEL